MSECCAVVSYPRSGTHLTLDFLRRNFEPFAYTPLPWESSKALYCNLDVRAPGEEGVSRCGMPRPGGGHLKAASRESFLVKTHELPFASLAKLQALANGRRVVLLYPFRAFSKTVLSYHAHRRANGTIEGFLSGPDPYLGRAEPVEQTIRAHAEWGLVHAVPLDVDRMIKEPHETADMLAARFGWRRISRRDPLPPKRVAPGFTGEIIERLRGRQSSEMVARVPKRPASEAAFVDERFAELHARLRG